MTAEYPSTLGDRRPVADICRERGWGPGTRLVGDEGGLPTIIEITALGEVAMLARVVSPHPSEHESSWVLFFRDWRPT